MVGDLRRADSQWAITWAHMYDRHSVQSVREYEIGEKQLLRTVRFVRSSNIDACFGKHQTSNIKSSSKFLLTVCFDDDWAADERRKIKHRDTKFTSKNVTNLYKVNRFYLIVQFFFWMNQHVCYFVIISDRIEIANNFIVIGMRVWIVHSMNNCDEKKKRKTFIYKIIRQTHRENGFDFDSTFKTNRLTNGFDCVPVCCTSRREENYFIAIKKNHQKTVCLRIHLLQYSYR